MKVPKNPQTRDARRSIESLQSKRRLPLRLAVKQIDINQMISFMAGHVMKQHLDFYYNLAQRAVQDSKEDEQL